MKTMLIIADDFTGALDTGVQLAACGIQTKVTTDLHADLKKLLALVQVVVMDTETRHLTPEEAWSVVSGVARNAAAARIDIIYKKTDSALRGNTGAEFGAVLDAFPNDTIYFAPAYPKVNRITKGGIQYTDGVPISESDFGRDPVNPVTESFIPKILQSACPDITCMVATPGAKVQAPAGGVIAYDAETNEDLQTIAIDIFSHGTPRLLAGCAGLASCLSSYLGAPEQTKQNLPKKEKLIVLCGSVNNITRKQVEYAQAHGFLRVNLLPHQFLNKDYFASKEGARLLNTIYHACLGAAPVMVCTMDVCDNGDGFTYATEHHLSRTDMVVLVQLCLGKISAYLKDKALDCTYLVTGGDTLVGVMHEVHGVELEPICEVGKGTVLANLYSSDAQCLQIVSKSGGFGEREIFINVARQLLKAEFE